MAQSCFVEMVYSSWDVAQMAESLPSMHEALGLIPYTT